MNLKDRRHDLYYSLVEERIDGKRTERYFTAIMCGQEISWIWEHGGDWPTLEEFKALHPDVENLIPTPLTFPEIYRRQIREGYKKERDFVRATDYDRNIESLEFPGISVTIYA